MGYISIIWKLLDIYGCPTAKQDTEKNKSEILLFANDKCLDPVEWGDEPASGVLTLKKCMIGALIEKAQPGNTIITYEISCFG